MIIDGFEIQPLENGGCTVTVDGVKTFHQDERAARRHVQRLLTDRAAYEFQRKFDEIFPR